MGNTYHRTMFIADLCGQYEVWRASLITDANRCHRIIQMGNLISIDPKHRDGPVFGVAPSQRQPNCNEETLKYIRLYRATQSHWLQLIGPAELIALNDPHRWTNHNSLAILATGWMSSTPSFVTAGVDKGRLITHGGLTHGLWVDLGRPSTASEAARLINQRYQGVLYPGPSMSLGGRPNFSADPILADPLCETYPSWITTTDTMPFSQVLVGSLSSDDGRTELNRERTPLWYFDDVLLQRWGSIAWLGPHYFLGLHLNPWRGAIGRLANGEAVYIERTPIDTANDSNTSHQ